MDPRVDNLLARQHGWATNRQVRELGFTRGQVDGMLRRGHLGAPYTGLVRAPGAPATPEAEAMVALLRCGPESRLIGPRALALLGIRGFARTDRFGVLIERGRDPRTRRGLSTFRDPDPDDGTVHVGALRLPRPARVLVEMARFAEGAELRAAVDAGAWAGRPDRASLLARAGALPSRYAPAARIRDLARSGALDLDSEPERRLMCLLGTRFGRVETQARVSPRRRVDLLLRQHNLVLEYDGADHRSEAGRARDDVRDAELRDLGFEVLHVHHEDFDAPDALLARVAAKVLQSRELLQSRG